MEITVFKDILWDLINESDALDVTDIQSNGKENCFIVTVKDEFTHNQHKSSYGE